MNKKDSNKKPQKFKISIRLQTEEVFPVNRVNGGMKIKELKSLIELFGGVPDYLQKLHYLDEADLMDHTDLRHNDIVPGAVLQCDVWPMWLSLLEAVAANDIENLLRLGITPNSNYRTPHSDYMTIKARRMWIAERALVALLMAVHRGNLRMVKILLGVAGADVNGTTHLGRTPLHIAAARGHGKVVELLLRKGADSKAEDTAGCTAATYASRYGHKDCERYLFLSRWQKRAASMEPEFQNLPRMAHQYHDSTLPVLLFGLQSQCYHSKILPPGEFEGTNFGSPKKRHRPKKQQDPTAEQDSSDELPKETRSEMAITTDLQGLPTMSQIEYHRSRLPIAMLGPKLFPRGKPMNVRKLNEAKSAAPLIEATKSLKQTNLMTSVLDKASETAARRRLIKEPNDSDIYGLVEIDDREEKQEKVMNSTFGRAQAYATRIYGHGRNRRSPDKFDDWMRRKAYEKRLKEEQLSLETEAEALKVEERRIARIERQKELEAWILETTADSKLVAANRTAVEKIRSTFRQGRDLSSYDLWVLKKEVHALEGVSERAQTSLPVT